MAVAIVVAGGESPGASVLARLPEAAVVIAADSGLDHALKLGLKPTVLVGDMDSISAAGLHWAMENGIEIQRHPTDKDSTDLELALVVAAERSDEVVVVDGAVGRIDHALGNLLLLASPRWAGVKLSALLPGALVTIVRGQRLLRGEVGDVVSLFAVGGPATGVSTTGLRWPLDNATLEPGSSLGTSNELQLTEATISLIDGAVLAIQEA